MRDQRQVRLDNGITVLAHRMPELASVATACYILSGTRDEAETEVGAAHFLEHMLFRGTALHPPEVIRHRILDWGAEMNAFTWWEATCIHIRTLPLFFDGAFALLSDMVQHPTIAANDTELERRVIEEEISRMEDIPRVHVVYDLYKAFYPNNPLGRVGIGTIDQVRALDHHALRAFYRKHYVPANLLVVVCGAFEWPDLERLVREHWSMMEAQERTGIRPAPPLPAPSSTIVSRPTLSHSHMTWGWAAPPLQDPDHYAAQLLAILLGDETGMGSRLYWAVREPGLCDRVQAIYTGLDGTGMLSVYASAAPGRTEEAASRVRAELSGLSTIPVSEAELNRAKRKLVSRLLVEAETSDMRMFSLARTWLINGELLTLDQVVQKLEATGPADIARILERYPVSRSLTEVIHATNLNG